MYAWIIARIAIKEERIFKKPKEQKAIFARIGEIKGVLRRFK